MTVYVGPTNWWWYSSPNSTYPCHVKSTVRLFGVGGVLRDGSAILCVGVSSALIVAPCCTQVGGSWAGGQYNSTLVGNKCCVSEWSALQTRLTQCGFTPSDWCVPNLNDLALSHSRRSLLPANFFSSGVYWSSNEFNSNCACALDLGGDAQGAYSKANSYNVRAFRIVTY